MPDKSRISLTYSLDPGYIVFGSVVSNAQFRFEPDCVPRQLTGQPLFLLPARIFPLLHLRHPYTEVSYY